VCVVCVCVRPLLYLSLSPTHACITLANFARARSSSFDGSIRLWDTATGKSRVTLAQHTALVYSLSFSSNGDYLVSSGADKLVCVWNVKDGSLVRTFSGPSACYDAGFSPDNEKVAACFSSGAVALIDLKL